MAVDRQAFGRIHPGLRPDAVAEAPAGHGVGLGPAVEQDEAIADRFIAKQAAMGLVVEDKTAIDLVRQHGRLGEVLETGNEAVELIVVDDAARWIARAVDDDQPRAIRQLRQHFIGAE